MGVSPFFFCAAISACAENIAMFDWLRHLRWLDSAKTEITPLTNNIISAAAYVSSP